MNGYGRPVQHQPPGTPATTYSYGSDGRLATALFAGLASETTKWTYDARGRLFSIDTPDGRSRQRSYSTRGLLLAESFGRPGNTLTTHFDWDDLGNLKSRTEAFGTRDAATTSFDYGPRGELRSVTLPTPGNEVWRYDYDGLARLSKVTPPPGGPLQTQQWTYDALGRVLTHLDGARPWSTDWSNGLATTTTPSLDVIERLSDSRGRLLSEVVTSLGSESAPSADHHFVFDGLDALRSMQEGSQPESRYGYDDSHRLQSVSRGSEPSVTYSFDGVSARVSRVSLSTGASTNYGFDAKARLNQVSGAWGATTVDWEPGGARLTSLTDGLVSESYCYDDFGRIGSIGADCNVVAPDVRRYAYDARGNPLSEEFGGKTRTLLYDSADRLRGGTDWDGVTPSSTTCIPTALARPRMAEGTTTTQPLVR